MGQKKILFRLQRDSEGYPPADVESVWAEESGDGAFVIDNIPFFAREATLGDEVTVTYDGKDAFYSSTRKRSGNSLLRVILFGRHDASRLRSGLDKLGCSSEQSHLNSLIAVNVPVTSDINKVRLFLDDGVKRGFWDYEEPLLRQ